MKVDAGATASLASIGARAVELEGLGYDGLRVAELNHDPFMPLAVAAEHTNSIELVTSKCRLSLSVSVCSPGRRYVLVFVVDAAALSTLPMCTKFHKFTVAEYVVSIPENAEFMTLRLPEPS